MSHKITATGLAAEVARTNFALPETDWNEHPCSHHGHHGSACPDAEKSRTGRATWGPRDRVEYRPRWTSDHHPWAALGPSGEPNGIRYSNQEVDED